MQAMKVMNRVTGFLMLFLVAGDLLQAQEGSAFQLVYQTFQTHCIQCHNPTSLSGGLDLCGDGTSSQANLNHVYQNLVGVQPQNATARSNGNQLIHPGRPDQSFLYRKVNGTFDPDDELAAGEGDQMPQDQSSVVSATEKEYLRQWILFGAPSNGMPFDTGLVNRYYAGDGLAAFPNGPPAAPWPGEGFQIKTGPFFLAPGTEDEFFQKYETGLKQDVEVPQIKLQISDFSHHFIMYESTNGGVDLPDGLRREQNHANVNIITGVQRTEDMVLPEGTAFHWDANYVLDLNAHVINYSRDKVFKAEVYINVYTQPSGTAAQEMHAVLVPNPLIVIPNTGDTVRYQQTLRVPDGPQIFVWGVLGHTHRYGVDYKVYELDQNGNRGAMLYDAQCADGIPGCFSPYFDYQHIPTRFFEHLLPIRLDRGIVHTAAWVNNGPQTVRWGPTSQDEMMVLGVFYVTDTTGLQVTASRHDLSVPSLQVFPNPARDQITFQTPGEEPGVLRIYDLQGRLIHQKPLQGFENYQWFPTQKSPVMLYQYITMSGRKYAGKVLFQ